MKPAPSDPASRTGSHGGVSFRSILLSVILGLILLSSLSTTLFSALGLGAVIRALLDHQIETTLDAVTGRVEDLFEPSDRLLHTFSKRIRTGTLPSADPFRLASEFSDALEFEDGLRGIYFGYADGRTAGAWIKGSQIVLATSSTEPGSWREWTWDSSGNLEPFARDTAPSRFDARERTWFQLAVERPGLAWTPPYEFADGERGLSVSEAVRADDGTLIGVVMVDFLLKEVTDYLEQLKEEYKGDTLVFSIRGHVLASPRGLSTDPIIEMIRKELEDPDVWEEIQKHGGHLRRNFRVPGDTFIVGIRGAAVPGDLECVSAIIFSRKEAFGALEATIFHGVITSLVALFLSLVAGFIMARRIANPLRELASAVARIGRFDLTPQRMPSSPVREIRALSDSVEMMRSGLQSFSHYVPMDLVRDLVHSGGVAGLGGERRDIALMFCDLAGFTSYAEKTDPEDAVKILTSYFEGFGRAVDANGGVIDKFLGDGLMVLFNAPARIPQPAASACRAALGGAAAMGAVESRFVARVGLHCGECLVGNVGTETRFTYTAIGDCVNLASRLEGLNKHFGTRIIASSTIVEAAGHREFLWRRLDRVAVAGRTAPLEIHELLGFREGATDAMLRTAEVYGQAFEAFLRRDLDTASRLLAPLLPADGPARVLAERIAREMVSPPDPEWEGINRFLEK